MALTVQSDASAEKKTEKKPSHAEKVVILRFTSITVGEDRERERERSRKHDELTDDPGVKLCFLSEKAKKQVYNKTKAIFQKRQNHYHIHTERKREK